MKTAALAFSLLLLFSSLQAEFLANYDSTSGKIWVRCDNQSSVFVSGQQGGAQRRMLDDGFQADFTPEGGGNYVVQCARETKGVAVPTPEPQTPVLAQGDSLPLTIAAAILFLLLALALFIFALRVLQSQSWFCKSVEGKRVRLALRAGENMKNVVISDPVAIGYSGELMEFSIPRLDAGKEWQAEYGIVSPKNALPASLRAECKSGSISILSQLIAEFPAGKPEKPAKKAAPAKKKVPKSLD